MAYFAIVNKDTLKVEHVYESDFIKNTGQYWPGVLSEPICAHVEINPAFDRDCVTATQNGEAFDLIEDSEKVTSKTEAVKQALVVDAYNRMNEDVYNQMLLVFGTSKSDSASAFFETWKLMVANPGLFSNESLLVEKDSGVFHIGDPLNTDEKVSGYANARISEANSYSVYRMKRIQQFREERNTILA